MEAYGMTDKGIVRQINQDTIYVSTEPIGNFPNLFIVADGMGGHQAGDYASRFTIEALCSYLQKQKENTPLLTQLNQGISEVNHQLVQLSMENPQYLGMGTTLVLATIMDHQLYVANVGDSRLYLISDIIQQISRDHSYVEELVALGKLTRDSEEYKMRKNIITRAVGNPDGVLVDFFEAGLEEDALILLCSDGLTNMLSDEEIHWIIQSHSKIQEKVEALIRAANQKGGQDNISVIVIQPY